VQESKSEKTISFYPKEKYENDRVKKPSDPSAYTSKPASKRGRSPRSSPDSKRPNSLSSYPPDKGLEAETKGGSEKTPAKTQRFRSMLSKQNLRMFVQSRLDQYKNDQDRYNGIIRILADAGFLQFCYMLIKEKHENINLTRGVTAAAQQQE